MPAAYTARPVGLARTRLETRRGTSPKTSLGGAITTRWSGPLGEEALHAHGVKGFPPPGAVARPVELVGDGAQGGLLIAADR